MNDLLRAGSVALLAVLAGCSATGYPIGERADEINATRDHAPVRIGVGDTLRVRFVNAPTWDQDARVRRDGVAVFPAIGEEPVVGLTLGELQQRLKKRYQGLPGEDVTVDLATSAGAATGGAGGGGAGGGTGAVDVVYVIGDVESPGSLPMTGRPLTLVEAIAAAGGHLKATANLRNTVLTRRLVSGEMRSWRLDADVSEWGVQPAIWLEPNDIVVVPNSAIDEVGIWVDNYIRRMIPIPTLFPAQ